MASLTIHIRVLLLCLVHLFLANLISCQCNTDQNPYCAGNNQFEQLCCAYPNVCYWSNRDGTPACCQAGTDCSSNGGPSAGGAVAFTAVQQTTQQTTYLVQTVYTSTQPQYSTITYYSSWQTWQPTTTTYVPPPVQTGFSTVTTPAVVVVTETSAVVAPVTTGGQYVTVTQVQVVGNRASRVVAEDWRSLIMLGGFVLTCGMALLM